MQESREGIVQDITDVILLGGKVAGLKFSWNKNEEVGWRIVDVWVEVSNGTFELLDTEAFYNISTFDHLR